MFQQTYAAAAYFSPLHEHARRQLDIYWRVRISKSIENLEREARRMLQLEEHLAVFAEEYYAVVGPWAEHLASLEASMPEHQEDIAPLPLALAQCGHRQARLEELKARYRQIALEIHPDRAMIEGGSGDTAAQMQAVNEAYARGDLAALLKCEAEILMGQFAEDWSAAEHVLRDIERAGATYAAGYRSLLNSPLNHLMLRAMAAAREGWDWMGAVITRIERAIAQRQEMLRDAAVAQAA